VEVNFGRDVKDPRFGEVKIPAAREGEHDIFVNGKIDRIDLGPGGAGVVDYKAGKKNKNAKRELLVTDFQLPAYVLALRQSLGVAQSDAAWLYLGDHESLTLSGLISKEQSLDELMALDADGRASAQREGKRNFANAVHAVVGPIRGGDLGARPQDCGRCSFSRVCRISQRRVGEEIG
jgi:RecB family exonuclease